MKKEIFTFKLKNIFTILVVFCLLFFSSSTNSAAQTLGLSISPPIDEVMIIPGKEVVRTFTITNNGNDGMASIYIIPFFAQGEEGLVALDEKNAVTASSPFATWFSLISPISTFGEKFYMAGGQRQDVTIKVSPPADSSEKDYYFTLLYELNNEIPGNIAPIGPTNQARIGANLLISLSEDGEPPKDPEIVEFSAPKIIDSLGKLEFNIRLGNMGSYFFKSNGEITIKPMIGSPETLALTPLNVISDSIRNISCLKGEETVNCRSESKVLIGLYKSTLKITSDEGGVIREKTVSTFAFPFSLLLVLIFVFATYRIIKNTKSKARNPLDNTIHGSNNRE